MKFHYDGDIIIYYLASNFGQRYFHPRRLHCTREHDYQLEAKQELRNGSTRLASSACCRHIGMIEAICRSGLNDKALNQKSNTDFEISRALDQRLASAKQQS